MLKQTISLNMIMTILTTHSRNYRHQEALKVCMIIFCMVQL